MGRNIHTKHVDDELDNFNPSCMWGIIHAIDYHHWRYNVKRLLPHRKNQGTHAKGQGTPKARTVDHVPGEMQMILHKPERTSPVNRSTKESATISKRSLRARIKAFIADHQHKQGNDKHRGSRSSSRSGLKRTYSIHHLEPPDHSFDGICTDWEHPIIFFPGNEDTGGTKHHNPIKSDVTEKPYADDGIRKFSYMLPASKAKSRLTKSGSFPVGDLSQRRNLGPSKLKHKQSEIWTTPRGENFPASNLMPMDVLKYSENFLSRSRPSADNSTASMLGRALSLILESTIESDEEGHTDFVMPPKEAKQVAKFDGSKDKNEANASHSALGEVSNRQDSSTIGNDFAESSAEGKINRIGDESSCGSQERHDTDYRTNTFSHRRSSSLSESLDKYASLFESTFRKEVKLQSSKSLRLSNKNEMTSGKSAPLLFTRIRSLSHLDELYTSIQNVVRGNADFGDWAITSTVETSLCTKYDTQGETSTEEYAAKDDTQESEHQNEMPERSDCIEAAHDSPFSGQNVTSESSTKMEDIPEQLSNGNCNFDRDTETNNSVITNNEFPEPWSSSASKNFLQDEASTFVHSQSAEDLESISDSFDLDPSINWQNISTSNPDDIAIPVHAKDPLVQNEADKKHNTDLDYVRDLLERSGLTKDGFQWTWHSLDQPLNPSVFEEMEANWHQEFDCSKEELWSCFHHQLLFELVNEELARLYDRSSTYYPKALSPSCHIRPFPVGRHLLEDICSSISSLISLKPEEMESLDAIVALDLKNAGWMNLQIETECMVLEIEDMIFDEILEELVSL